MTVDEVIKNCRVEDTKVYLPDFQLDRKTYLDVSKKLNMAGGKWDRKSGSFLFREDPSEYLGILKDGGKVNLKKEFQFFATPDNLADEIVQLADIQYDETVLEPSAGQGAIISAVRRRLPGKHIYYCEIMGLNRMFLDKIDKATFIQEDFLTMEGYTFDKIVMNPPFTKNADVIHVLHAYNCLKPNGRLVSVMSKHWQMSDNKRETTFRDWLYTKKHTVKEIEAGAFKEAGTGIATVLVVIEK